MLDGNHYVYLKTKIMLTGQRSLLNIVHIERYLVLYYFTLRKSIKKFWQESDKYQVFWQLVVSFNFYQVVLSPIEIVFFYATRKVDGVIESS